MALVGPISPSGPRVGCCVGTASDVRTRGRPGSPAARPENGKSSRCGVWCGPHFVSSGVRVSADGSRLCDGGQPESDFDGIPGDVRVCGRVSWRQTSCRGGHYPFSDYGMVVRDDAGASDRCPRYPSLGNLGSPWGGLSRCRRKSCYGDSSCGWQRQVPSGVGLQVSRCQPSRPEELPSAWVVWQWTRGSPLHGTSS